MSDCVPIRNARSRAYQDVIRAGIRTAHALGGTPSLISNGRGKRIANLDSGRQRKQAHKLLYMGGLPEEDVS